MKTENKLTNANIVGGFFFMIGLAALINAFLYCGTSLYQAQWNIMKWETDSRQSFAVGATILLIIAIILWISICGQDDDKQPD